MNSNIVSEVYSRNYGSEQFFKRDYYSGLIYTEGLKDFQQTLHANWFVDEVISHMDTVKEIYNKENDGFFVITLNIDESKRLGKLDIYREGYINNKYNDHITVLKKDIYDIDLPKYDYKFYLILSNLEPVLFTLLLPSEY